MLVTWICHHYCIYLSKVLVILPASTGQLSLYIHLRKTNILLLVGCTDCVQPYNQLAETLTSAKKASMFNQWKEEEQVMRSTDSSTSGRSSPRPSLHHQHTKLVQYNVPPERTSLVLTTACVVRQYIQASQTKLVMILQFRHKRVTYR